MHCPNCGQKTSSEVKFCRACGMKLDSVARAVSEHKGEPEFIAPDSTDRDRQFLRTFVSVLSVGFLIVFIGVVMVILGKPIYWVKTTGALLAVIGVFIAIFGSIYATILESKKEGHSRSPKRELEETVVTALPSGDGFRPASSVTESTTRDLVMEHSKTQEIK